MAIAAASAVQAGLGVAQTVAGLIGSAKAKKEAEKLAASRPKYSINPNVQSEVSLAESELGNGMGAEATNAYEQGIDRDLSTTLDALLKSGGTPNNIAQTFDASEQGRQKLAIMKDNLRLNQVNNLVSAYRNQTGETDKAFLYNIDAPWKDAAQANAAARTQSNQQIWGGLNTVGSAAMNFAGGTSSANQFSNFLKPPSSNATTSNNTLQMPPVDVTSGVPSWVKNYEDVITPPNNNSFIATNSYGE